MTRPWRFMAVAATAAAFAQGGTAWGQWGYPVGYANYGWAGWGGGGGGTVQGSIARGLGVYAAGAGYYNQQTAVARSINADTVTRWNQYWYESQRTANRAERERLARRQYGTTQARDKIYKRLRDNPEPRDIETGDALNVAMEEINDPRVYSRALAAATARVGGETIRNIPFQYASAAITTSIRQITQGGPPPSLKDDPRFESERSTLRAFGSQIRAQVEKGEDPDPATIDRALAAVNTLEAKADATLKKNSPERVAADKYLKSLHGLLAMLKTPALDVLLAGVEKRPDATLAELLQFMNACNLRFGVATTPRQKQIYNELYPQLVALRDRVAPALAADTGPGTRGTEPGEFFSGMDYPDLQKKAPAPPSPGTPKGQ